MVPGAAWGRRGRQGIQRQQHVSPLSGHTTSWLVLCRPDGFSLTRGSFKVDGDAALSSLENTGSVVR